MAGSNIKIVKNGTGDIIVLSWWMRVAGAVLATMIAAGAVNAVVQLSAIPVLRTRIDGQGETLSLLKEQLEANTKRMEEAVEGANQSRAAVAEDVRALSEALTALRIEMAEQRGEGRKEKK
jgi:hypothetical protein